MEKVTAIILVLLAALVLSAEAYSQTTVVVDPQNYFVSINDTASVTFRVNNVTNLHSASLLVKWNKNIIKYVTALQGTFFPGGSFFGTQPPANLVQDSVIVDQVILGPSSVSGSGLLFTIKFKALINGVSPVTIAYADLRDPANNQISNTVTSGTVNVGASVNANLKIMLQGPYNTGTSLMNTTLNSSGLLPLAQPYNTAPWNYTGTENVAASFFTAHPDIVDWILIELRTGTAPATMVSRKTGFIRSDGSIVDHTTGNTSIRFDGLASGNYYVVVHYASHLVSMSASAIAINNASPLYDFTTGADKHYGNVAKQITTGVYGLYCGDIDYNYLINATDKNLAYNARGTFGYMKTDVDRNGLVNATDKNLAYNNRGIFSAVPQ